MVSARGMFSRSALPVTLWLHAYRYAGGVPHCFFENTDTVVSFLNAICISLVGGK
jgi:hypothetical protein